MPAGSPVEPFRRGTLTVDFDAYVQPGARRGKSARTVLIVGGKEITAVDYRLRLMP